MASSPQVLEYLHIRLRLANDRKVQDHLLDIILENRTHATEWDALHWGFSARWMRKELEQISVGPIMSCAMMDHR